MKSAASIFRTITATDWLNSIARARMERNEVRAKIDREKKALLAKKGSKI
jgi:hypothetical protein